MTILPLVQEVCYAYADANSDHPNALELRRLQFCASEAVGRDEAVDIMKAAIPSSYNDFRADLLKLLPADALITIAREYSPCFYVKGEIARIAEMRASEWHYNPLTDATRIWFD
jgi:hypothetical protein